MDIRRLRLKVASYNIHKAVGLDRRRDPDRILSVLHEIDADVVMLQECDRRFGSRQSVLPRARIEDSDYRPVTLDTRPGSLGWHGNGVLVKKHIEVVETAIIDLPTLEPRGAIRADVKAYGGTARVVGMHLDLSGIRRRHQVEAIMGHVAECAADLPTILMGDTNEWSTRGGILRQFGRGWQVLDSGPSFPTRYPIARLDRIVMSQQWQCEETAVHRSLLAARASDHLPVWAALSLTG